MTHFLKGLDRYLTTEPDDGYDQWCEAVTEAFSDEFFEANEDWILTNNGVCSLWMDELQYMEPTEAARVIEIRFVNFK